MQDQNVDRDDALDARCRAAIRTHRTDAFDNVDVAALLGRRLSLDDAR